MALEVLVKLPYYAYIATIYGIHMFKTQIYIPEKTNDIINALSKKTGISKSELLRNAIDEFLKKYEDKNLDTAFGIWKGYDLDLRSIRNEWEK